MGLLLLAILVCREQLQDLYVRLHDLIEYNQLNKEGFRKALKKHDKVLSGVAPKRLDEQRPRWEGTLSDTSKEKLQVCATSPIKRAALPWMKSLRELASRTSYCFYL